MLQKFDFGRTIWIYLSLGAYFQIPLTYATLGKFSIEQDKQIVQSVTTEVVYITKSLMECGMRFHSNENCCVAVYEELSGTCQMYTSGCCTTHVETTTGRLLIRRDITGFIQKIEDCSYHKNAGGTSGVYTIYPEALPSGMSVYCDMDTDDGGWTVIQNRYDGSEDFFRTWTEYKDGFGSLTAEFWLGNDKIHILTYSDKYVLRVDVEDTGGQTRYAKYYTFRVSDETDRYRLTIAEYCGNSGDALFYNNNHTFHTKDNDNTVGFNGNQCAIARHAGFWFDECTWANPNGMWTPGVLSWDAVFWYQWKDTEGLSKMSMKIRRK